MSELKKSNKVNTNHIREASQALRHMGMPNNEMSDIVESAASEIDFLRYSLNMLRKEVKTSKAK